MTVNTNYSSYSFSKKTVLNLIRIQYLIPTLLITLTLNGCGMKYVGTYTRNRATQPPLRLEGRDSIVQHISPGPRRIETLKLKWNHVAKLDVVFLGNMKGKWHIQSDTLSIILENHPFKKERDTSFFIVTPSGYLSSGDYEPFYSKKRVIRRCD